MKGVSERREIAGEHFGELEHKCQFGMGFWNSDWWNALRKHRNDRFYIKELLKGLITKTVLHRTCKDETLIITSHRIRGFYCFILNLQEKYPIISYMLKYITFICMSVLSSIRNLLINAKLTQTAYKPNNLQALFVAAKL